MALCYQKQNWEHDVNRRTSQGLHAPFVKLWYSPSAVQLDDRSEPKGSGT